jgi:hypothetical protein
MSFRIIDAWPTVDGALELRVVEEHTVKIPTELLSHVLNIRDGVNNDDDGRSGKLAAVKYLRNHVDGLNLLDAKNIVEELQLIPPPPTPDVIDIVRVSRMLAIPLATR